MAIPSEKDIELPLLKSIETAGGEARPSELYDEVARYFPKLTLADRQIRHPRSNIRIWSNRIQWARQHLVDKGEIDASIRGIWKITERGRARVGVVPPLSPPPPPPVSTIRTLLDMERQQVCTELHEMLMSLHPKHFEEFAGKLLKSKGFTNVEVTKYVGDGGIDGYGNFDRGLINVKAAFQVKRWSSNVPRKDISQLRGDIQGECELGVFITTSDYTAEAKKAAKKPGAVPILLLNGDEIVDIMLEKGLGVRQEPLTVSRVDKDFFATLGTGKE